MFCFQSAAALSWAKEKSETSARNLSEMAETYNKLSGQYNDLKKSIDLKDAENARLKKKIEELEVDVSARDKALKDAQYKADYFEDRSMSMKLFTTVKIRAEMVKEFSEGKTTAWDLEAASKAWEEMKLLYSDSEGEEEHATEDPGASQIPPHGAQVEETEVGDESGAGVGDIAEK